MPEVTDAPEGAFSHAVDELLSRGDAPLALHVADVGLLGCTNGAALHRGRALALVRLRERYDSVDPFRFIMQSEGAGEPLPPVGPAPTRER